MELDELSESVRSTSARYTGRLEPTDLNAPKFDGRNITDFLEEYGFEADRVGWDEDTRKLQLPYFCTQRYKTFIRKLPSYYNKTVSWQDYQKELCSLYASLDENRKRGTRAFIESYVREVQKRQPSVKIVEYYHNFITYFTAAKNRNQVVEAEKGHFFFRGLAREDMERVMHLMPSADRPKLDDISSFKIEKIYEFVREHQEQEEGLNALNTDFASVSGLLAQRDAAILEDTLPSFDMPREPHRTNVPGILQLPQPVRPASPRIDPAVSDLIRQFNGLTLSVEQFTYLTNNNLAVRRLMANPENYAEAYKQLVLRPQRVDPAVLERNDGSFKSIYPPTMHQNANAYAVGNRNGERTRCRGCGSEGHVIINCPHLKLMKDNRWFHTRTERSSNGFAQTKYYFGPYPNELWGLFPGGGVAPRPFDSEVLDWVLRSLKERFQVNDDQLKNPMQSVLPSWFDAAGRPIMVERLQASGESHTVEASEDGALLAQQTMALRAAAKFLENVSETGEVHNTEPTVYAIDGRTKAGRKAAEERRKEARLGKKPSIPRMKSSRSADLFYPPVEEEEPEVLRHQAVVDLDESQVPETQWDRRDSSATASVRPRATQSVELDPEVVHVTGPKPLQKVKSMTVPTSEDLAALARNTSPTVIAQAMLYQEVRGIRQVDLLAAPEFAAVIGKALEDARKQRVRFDDRRSGETMAVQDSSDNYNLETTRALQEMFEWGTGETFAVEVDRTQQEVITSDVLRRLCPKLNRGQQALLKGAEEANELHDFQSYEIGEEEDGYVEEQSRVPSNARIKGEAQQQRYAIKGQLPTCWVALNGGMGRALIDTGSQLNVMRLSTARALNVYITEMDQSTLPMELQQGMITADGGMDPFVGTAYSVPIMIGGVLIPTHFRIVRKLRRAILLGTPWCATARLQVQFDTFGRTLCYIKSLDGRREVSFVGCDPAPTANSLSIEHQGNE